MIGKDYKLPIQEGHHFLRKEKVETLNRKFAIVAVVLLLTAMTLMTVFTFQSINGLSELRQEVDDLKAALKKLQQKEEKHQDGVKLEVLSDYNDASLGDYEYEADLDYASYENYDNDEYDDDNNTQPLTGENYTKDAKTLPPRPKRSIISYNQDGTPINAEEYPKKNNRRNYRGGMSPSSSSQESRQLYSRRLHVYQDEFQPEETQENSNVELVGDNPTRHRQRRLELDDQQSRTGRIKPLPAAHFSGDTSKYVLGQHDNFNGNGHLSHPHRIFVDWSESSWFHTLGMNRYFSLSDGVVTIKESGLYFIYAQIYYYDEHDVNGFRVHRNDNETLLQCTTTTHSTGRVLKGNTCFTASVEYLNENDKISIGDISQSRYSLFEPGKSFFGVIKLGDVKIK